MKTGLSVNRRASILLIVVVAGLATVSGRCILAQDYSPCRCQVYPTLLPLGTESHLTCHEVSVEEKNQVFASTDASAMDLFVWFISPDEPLVVLDDVLSTKRFNRIEIRCLSKSTRLMINAGAFNTGCCYKATSIDLGIYGCDLSLLTDYSFLSDETAQAGAQPPFLATYFSSLVIQYAVNIPHLIHLPESLPRLTYLKIYDCSMREDSTDPYSRRLDFPSLTEILIQQSSLADDALDKFIIPLSAPSVVGISLRGNQLTRVPAPIPRNFPLLSELDFAMNKFELLPTDALIFPPAIRIHKIDFKFNSLKTIEPGAIQVGSFAGTRLDLERNYLTTLEAQVFHQMIAEMSLKDPTISGINLSKNPIDCSDCDLAWLVRDRELMIFVYQGQCTNTTFLHELDPNGYNYCDETTETSATTASTTDAPPTTTFTPSTTDGAVSLLPAIASVASVCIFTLLTN